MSGSESSRLTAKKVRAVCVGGPLAGRIVEMPEQFRAQIPSPPAFHHDIIAASHSVHYKIAKLHFRSEEGLVFFQPAGQSIIESLRQMMAGYVESAAIAEAIKKKGNTQ